jgi:YggT family protein
MGYLANAGALLVELIFGLAVTLFVLRVLLQLVGASFYNPVSQFIYKASNPVTTPLRKLLRPIGRFDLAAALVAWVLECVKVVLLFLLVGIAPAFLGVLVLGFAELLGFVLTLYFWLILIGVVLSFVGGGAASHPVVPLIAQLTAPVLRPFRRILPDMGGFDLSPLFATVALLLARLLIAAPLRDFGTLLARG